MPSDTKCSKEQAVSAMKSRPSIKYRLYTGKKTMRIMRWIYMIKNDFQIAVNGFINDLDCSIIFWHCLYTRKRGKFFTCN